MLNGMFPVLQIAGVVSFTGDEVAQITVFITSIVSLIALVLKQGQSKGPTLP